MLVETDLAAGDFVRLAKQMIDLLDQMSIVADAELGATARRRSTPCDAASSRTAPSRDRHVPGVAHSPPNRENDPRR